MTETSGKLPMFEPSLRSRVAPFLAMDVLGAAGALERGGRDIVHLELGEPGAPAPRRYLSGPIFLVSRVS